MASTGRLPRVMEAELSAVPRLAFGARKFLVTVLFGLLQDYTADRTTLSQANQKGHQTLLSVH